MKNKIIIIISILFVLLSFCGCNKRTEKDNNQVNINNPTPENPINITTEELIKDQTVESLKFTNTKINYNGIMTTFDCKVTNISDQDITLPPVVAYITYENEYGEERILEKNIYFGESLKAGESISTSNNIDMDLRKATKLEYKIVKY